jgi:hypothetical protein
MPWENVLSRTRAIWAATIKLADYPVFRLTTRSYLVGAWTGRSAGN